MSAAYRYERPAETPCMIAVPMPVSSDVAKRVYLVRLASGPENRHGVRRPLSFAAFAVRIEMKTGRHFCRGTLARIEIGRQAAQLVDIEAIAAVDPLHRGKCWLAFGGER